MDDALATEKAGKWYGYDFSGMFGLWNSNLFPEEGVTIGYDYICSTVVVAAYNFSGVKIHATNRKGLIDIVTPYQVVTSVGERIDTPNISIEFQKIK